VVFGGRYICISNAAQGYYRLDITTIPCFRCGTCCSRFQARIDISEAHRICHEIGLNLDRFVAEFTDTRWPGTKSFLIKHINGECIFLRSSDNPRQFLCSIHEFKPICCLDWKPGVDLNECKEGLSKRWSLEADTTGGLRGTQESVQLFSQYVHSLDLDA
jgi:Fe-S-cluster containining protein